MADLEGIAHHKGVRVEHHDSLHRGRWGEYDARRHIVRLLTGLGPVQHRSVLAHELGHAHHRHRRTTHRTELEADVYAARILIAHDCWRHVTVAHEDLLTVAHELSVLPRLVEVYALHLARHPAIRHH